MKSTIIIIGSTSIPSSISSSRYLHNCGPVVLLKQMWK